jgi:hypothetical protein
MQKYFKAFLALVAALLLTTGLVYAQRAFEGPAAMPDVNMPPVQSFQSVEPLQSVPDLDTRSLAAPDNSTLEAAPSATDQWCRYRNDDGTYSDRKC